MIDTRPDIMLLQRDIPINLQESYKEIEKEYTDKTLSRPLEAFFGNLTRRNGETKKKPSLVLYDNKVNIDQMRVLYNSMTQPVTYVQGPPGTGKTQTILNVILCAFVQNQSVLVCSSNNTPVDGIKDKLNFKYKDKDVPFPYLRLGNNEEIAKSTRRIYELYNNAVNEIGCIHTLQGYDLNYVGVIIGNEIDYDPIMNKIVINRNNFYDKNVKNSVDDETLRRYIINSYKVIMTRGIKGCNVYVCNSNLKKYLERFIGK